MGDVLGEVLAQAVGIAISPLPVIAAILMLLSARGRGAVVGLLAGWVLGIAAMTTAVAALSSFLPDNDPDASQPIQGTIQLLVAAGFFVLAARQWRGRRRGDEEPRMPGWMAAIDTITPAKALALGVLLVVPNPKNTVLTATAGMSIGGTGLTVAEEAIVIAVFTLVAASSVAAPAVAFLASGERLRRPLDALRDWLVRNNAVVVAAVMFGVGVSMVSDGIASLA